MRIKNRVNKLKTGLLSSVFIASVITAVSVYAEYYFATGSCMEPVCGVHRYHRIHHLHHIAYHHRYHHYVFRHIIVSPCPCGDMVWTEHICTTCGYYWVPNQTIEYGYVVEPRGYHYYYGDEDYINYDPDLATGDDNQSIHPDMDIDY